MFLGCNMLQHTATCTLADAFHCSCFPSLQEAQAFNVFWQSPFSFCAARFDTAIVLLTIAGAIQTFTEIAGERGQQ